MKKIRKNPNDRVLAGVCSGIAQTYGFNPLWLRIPLAVLFFYWFPWIMLLYFLAAIIIPKENVAFEELKYKRFYRIKNKKILGGICTGLQHYTNIDVVLIRLIMFGLCFACGIGILLYLILWIISPIKELKTIETKELKILSDK